jgi:hypothetical protein
VSFILAKPAAAVLGRGEALPPRAGLMGVITLEDVLEELLQEKILYETDKLERNEQRLAKWVLSRWHLFLSINGKLSGKGHCFQSQDPKMRPRKFFGRYS